MSGSDLNVDFMGLETTQGAAAVNQSPQEQFAALQFSWRSKPDSKSVVTNDRNHW